MNTLQNFLFFKEFMKKRFITNFITITITSATILAMEEFTIENYTKYTYTLANKLTQNTPAVLPPTDEEEKIPTNIFYCTNNTWYNLFPQLANDPNLYNNPVTTLCLFQVLNDHESNLLPLLKTGVKILYKNQPIKSTVFTEEFYITHLSSVIGSILPQKNNILLSPKEFKTLRKLETILVQATIYSTLSQKKDLEIIYFIVNAANQAIQNTNNINYNVIIPINKFNILNELPFKKEQEIIDLLINQEAQKTNAFLQKCLDKGILIFFTLTGDIEHKSASINFAKYSNTDTAEKKKSKCSLQ